MPRTRSDRNTVHEKHLARRVREEREAREWTLESLAHAMTTAGCPMDRFTVHKIETGARKVTTSELAAFSKVFQRSADSLIWPIDREVAWVFKRYQAAVERRVKAEDEIKTWEARLLDLADQGYAAEVAAALADAGQPAQLQFTLWRLSQGRAPQELLDELAKWDGDNYYPDGVPEGTVAVEDD